MQNFFLIIIFLFLIHECKIIESANWVSMLDIFYQKKCAQKIKQYFGYRTHYAKLIILFLAFWFFIPRKYLIIRCKAVYLPIEV